MSFPASPHTSSRVLPVGLGIRDHCRPSKWRIVPPVPTAYTLSAVEPQTPTRSDESARGGPAMGGARVGPELPPGEAGAGVDAPEPEERDVGEGLMPPPPRADR